jgi:hypothetical protein
MQDNQEAVSFGEGVKAAMIFILIFGIPRRHVETVPVHQRSAGFD